MMKIRQANKDYSSVNESAMMQLFLLSSMTNSENDTFLHDKIITNKEKNISASEKEKYPDNKHHVSSAFFVKSINTAATVQCGSSFSKIIIVKLIKTTKKC